MESHRAPLLVSEHVPALVRNEYVFYVNGRETWRADKAVSRRGQFIILSAELSGWGGDPAKGTFPDEVRFDYVRVYQKK